jgi:hypothetical protein
MKRLFWIFLALATSANAADRREVRIGGHWLPLDAAGYRPGIADAARFQFDSYSLQDNLAAGSLAGWLVYGNMESPCG